MRARHSETPETLRPQARASIAVPLPFRCDCYATVCCDLGLSWTYSRQSELSFLSSVVRCHRRVRYVVL
jgi:hypothetical protein